MNPFELTADLLTGIEKIDNQHRKLISWANFLACDDADTSTLDNLQSYVVYYFWTEEEAMDKYNYGKLEKHKKQHTKLMNIVAQLFSRAKGKDTDQGTLTELQYLLTDWIQPHIKEWDRPLPLL